MTDENVDPKSQTATVLSVYGKSEQTLKDEGVIPIDEDAPEVVEVSDQTSAPGPATGTKFEDPKMGSTWEIPVMNPPAHRRPDNLDPRINGPFLDEVRLEEEQVRAEARHARNNR